MTIKGMLRAANHLAVKVRGDLLSDRFIGGIRTVESMPAISAALGRGTLEVVRGHVKYAGAPRVMFADPRLWLHLGERAIIELADWDPAVTAESSAEQIPPVMPGFPEASGIGMDPNWNFINPPVANRTKVFLRKDAKLRIGPNSLIFRGSYLGAWLGATLDIGSNVIISNDVMIYSRCGLTIGSGTMIAQKVFIMDYDGHPIFNKDGSPGDDTYGGAAKKISIGSNVWIGTGAMILKGVTIGTGAIVAAGSRVTQNVPSHSIVAGNPAKVVKSEISWNRY